MLYKEHGFTLIEIMMVILIIAIIAIPATLFFKKQTEYSLWESHRLDYRSGYVTFLTKFRWELKLAKKDTAEIFDSTAAQASSGIKILFEYVDPRSTGLPPDVVYVGYRYDTTGFRITREIYDEDWVNKLSQNVVMEGVQNSSTGADIFRQEDEFEIVTITVAPHGRGPIPDGSTQETFSAKIAPRN